MKTTLALSAIALGLFLGCSSTPPDKSQARNATTQSAVVTRQRGAATNAAAAASTTTRRTGPDSPPATDEISWRGTSTNQKGEKVANILVDTTEAPELADWGKHAGELCAEWYPKIAVLLGVEGDLRTNRDIKLWFREGMRGVANTSPREGLIRISASYVQDHTNDWGMVVHELVHTVQSFGGRNSPAPAFAAEDIKDPVSLAAKLKEHADPVSRFLWERLSEATRQELLAGAADGQSKKLPSLLVKDLNDIVRTNSLYQESRFADVALSDATKSLAGQDLAGGRLIRFNRLLLEDAYPQDIARRRGSRGAGGSWLTEGIADYIRLAHFEPDAPLPRPINPDKAKYTDSYKTTATFFRWIEKTYDPNLVKKINLALRDGKYKLELFEEFTGKPIDQLWTEFTDSLRAGQQKASEGT